MMAEPISTVRAGKLWTPDGWLSDSTLTITDGRISAIGPAADDGLNVPDGIVIPGLVDLQVNGALNHSFQSQDRAHFVDILRYHLRAGTTTLLPTLITAPEATLLKSLSELSAYNVDLPVTLPGIHLEGPFLAPEKSGAHDTTALCDPDLSLAQRYFDAARGNLRLLTLAPELPGADTVIRFFAERSVVVSAGHSAAPFNAMQAAVNAGLSLVTHAGNASDWPHRAMGAMGFMTSEPGVVGSLLAIEELSGGVIMDGFHFHPALLAPLLKVKGVEKLLLVSDASTVAGCEPGSYTSGGLIVEVHPEGYATSGRGGGWLAGSTITLLDAVQRAVKLAGISLHDAVTMAALTPARFLNLHDRKGHLNIGADADLLVLDADLNLRHVVAQGMLVSLD
jgi:N-acetylglucosamine-6-phosphate deacetylase